MAKKQVKTEISEERKFMYHGGMAMTGIILDPEKAREDLKPWSQVQGGVINDTLNEVDAVEVLTQSLGHASKNVETKEVIKIKCQSCKALNDEDAVFCKACGEKI